MELVWMRVLADRLRADLGCPLSPGAVSLTRKTRPRAGADRPRDSPRAPGSPATSLES
jgi:hypothetical protein